jgi:hypothetical protein
MRIRSAAALAALLSALTGCATLRATVGGWEGGPAGISLPQYRLREALSRGDFAAAADWPEEDALLRELTAGAASYYAAKYDRSAAMLDSAALLADDRITASISKDALSLLTNDMARPYQPRRTERLFVAYYGMLSYARLEKWEDAAVEARRMVSLLAQNDADRDDAERPLHAAMEYLAGAIFERAGERGEAAVSYRAAHLLASAIPAQTKKLGSDGEVLLVVERGFVAHRTTQTISIRLDEEESESIHSDRVWDGVARRVTARMDSRTSKHGYRQDYDDDGDDIRRLSIAFPVLRRTTLTWPGTLHLTADSSVTTVASISASVDDASGVDERRARLAIITRAVARAATKYAVAKAVEDKKGELASTIAELGGNLLERSDIRSWHVLPQELELIRLRVPSGARNLILEVGSGSSLKRLRIPSVQVQAGTVSIVPVRLWQSTQFESATPAAAVMECGAADCRQDLP